MEIRLKLLLVILLSLDMSVQAQRIELLVDSVSHVHSVNMAQHPQNGLYLVRTQDGESGEHSVVISRLIGPVLIDIDTMPVVSTTEMDLNIVNAFFLGNKLYIFGPNVVDFGNTAYPGSMYWDDNGFHRLSNGQHTNRLAGQLGGTSIGSRIYYAPNPAPNDTLANRGVISYDTLSETFQFEYPFIESYRSIRSVGDSLFVLGKRYSVTQEYVYVLSGGELLDSVVVNACNSKRPILQSDSVIVIPSGEDSLIYIKSGVRTSGGLSFTNCNIHDIAFINDSFFFMDQQFLHRKGPAVNTRRTFYGQGFTDSLQRLDMELLAGDLYIAGVSAERKMYFGQIHRGPVIEVRGFSFTDLDSDCVKDSNETSRDVYIGLDGTRYGARVLPSGLYQFFVSGLEGPQLLASSKGPYLGTTLCSLDSTEISINGSDTLITHDFIFTPSLIQDHAIDVSSTVARRGEWMYINLTLSSPGFNQSQAVSMELEMDSRIAPNLISAPGFVKNGNTYSFTESNSSNLAGKTYTFIGLLDTAAVNVGDTLLFVAHLTSKDADSLNDLDTLRVIVSGPYDPNHKFCYPEGAISASVREIEYTIEFQNTGSSYATKVIVVDTVDTRLPLKEIRMTGTSHPAAVKLIVRNNVLIWVFEDIYLPDSGLDQLGSKGYISYKAYLISELPLNDQITNRAYIYFDYEDPVVTDEAIVYRTDSSTGGPVFPIFENVLYVYPNPSIDHILVFSNLTIEEEVEVIDATGKLVMTFVIRPEQKNIVSVSWLSPGMYFLRSRSGSVGKFIKQ